MNKSTKNNSRVSKQFKYLKNKELEFGKCLECFGMFGKWF